MARRGRFTLIELLIVVAILGIIAAIVVPALSDRQPPPAAGPAAGEAESTAEREAREQVASLEARLTPAPATAWTDGLAAIVLVDVSGSMHDRIRGERRRKIEAAQAAANDLVGAFARYAAAHPALPVRVGIHEFSARRGQPAARQVVPLGAPDPLTAKGAIGRMRTGGGTPIGEAMVEARLALDRSGLSRRHLLVVTDGENTDGVHPALVARLLERQPDAVRASLYFIAFDVDAAAFAEVKNAGGMLLSARSGAELAATFDELLSDQILVEAPRETVERPREAVETPRPR
jgi:prepilin-type N-terminal cleavage/methylation domain-containing protein